MDAVKIITEQINSKAILGQLGKSVGAKPAEVKKVTELGLPTLVKALQTNLKTPAGAAALSKALDDHGNDSVENISGFLENVDLKDGAKILKHVFSGDDKKVQNNIAKQVGLKSSQVSGIMSQLAPVLIGALASQKKEQSLGVSGISDLLDILSGQLGGGGLMNIVAAILGTGGGGDILSQVGGLLGKLIKTDNLKATSAKTTKAKTTGTKKKTTTAKAPVKKITKTVKKKP